MGPLIPPFQTSGDVSPGFPAYNGFLRCTSGATPANLLMASMAGKPF